MTSDRAYVMTSFALFSGLEEQEKLWLALRRLQGLQLSEEEALVMAAFAVVDAGAHTF